MFFRRCTELLRPQQTYRLSQPYTIHSDLYHPAISWLSRNPSPISRSCSIFKKKIKMTRQATTSNTIALIKEHEWHMAPSPSQSQQCNVAPQQPTATEKERHTLTTQHSATYALVVVLLDTQLLLLLAHGSHKVVQLLTLVATDQGEGRSKTTLI